MAKKKAKRAAGARPAGKKKAAKKKANKKKARRAAPARKAKPAPKKKPARKKKPAAKSRPAKRAAKKTVAKSVSKKKAGTKKASVSAKKPAAKKQRAATRPAPVAAAPSAPAAKPAYRAPARSPLRGTSLDDYVTTLPDWQQEIVQAVRKLVRDTAPDSTEAMKWGQPVFEVNGPFCYVKPHAAHVNFGFWRGTDLPDPRGLLEGAGDRMRHVKLTKASDIPADALASFVRLSAELNRACGSPAIPQASGASG